MHSLGDILAAASITIAIDGVLRRSEAVESRETEAYRASLEKRELARQRDRRRDGAQGITALAYPDAAPKARARSASRRGDRTVS